MNLGLIIGSKICIKYCLKYSKKSRLSCHDPNINCVFRRYLSRPRLRDKGAVLCVSLVLWTHAKGFLWLKPM